jgi:ribonuclease E
MSRQRIRSSVLESSTEKCPHCGGTGHVRSVASVALQLLRSLEEMLLKGATHDLIVRTRSEVALYLLNYKRAHLRALEERFQITILINADPTVGGQVSFLIERGEQVHSLEQARALAAQALPPSISSDEEDTEEIPQDEGAAAEPDEGAAALVAEQSFEAADQHHDEEADQNRADAQEHGQGRRRRRRRRGRRGGDGRDDGALQREPSSPAFTEAPPAAEIAEQEADFIESPAGTPTASVDASTDSNGDRERRRRRRGRRGGRRNRHDRDAEARPPQDDQFGSQPSRIADSDLTAELDDTAPAPASAMQPLPATAEQVEPPAPMEARTLSPAQAAEPSPLAQSEEPARRRSTVREPAFASSRDDGDEPASSAASRQATPDPVISSSEDNAPSDRPRRSGWWSRRALDRQ